MPFRIFFLSVPFCLLLAPLLLVFLIELESLFKLVFIISSKNITELLFGLVKNSSLFFLGLIVVVVEDIVEI